MCHKIAKAEVDEVMYLKAREGETPVGLCEWISQPANHSGCSSQSDNLLCHNRPCVDGGPVSNLQPCCLTVNFITLRLLLPNN